MKALGFKLGHRRKLQRAIREYNSLSESQTQYGASSFPMASTGMSTNIASTEIMSHSPQPTARNTRPYRRHPRADPNSPRKPKTAYVLFGEYTRQDPALSYLSFVDIAKEVGKRWRELDQEERVNLWEKPAAERLKAYKEEIERYKQTGDYQKYQKYLETFKQGHHVPESMVPSENRSLFTSEPEISTQLPAFKPPTDSEAASEGRLGTDNLDVNATLQGPTSPVETGMDEIQRIVKSLGVNSHVTRFDAFPPEQMTTKVVEAFLHGTGSLLYLWNQDEALNMVKSVYHPQSDSILAYATDVYAMAAVGTYCDAEAPIKLLQDNFLQAFLYMLSLPSDISNFRHMRLFACLAIFRFTNSVESARNLIFSALSIGRQAFTSPSIGTDLSEDELRYWWHVFRSVVFLESWFAYNTSHESRVTNEDLSLYQPNHSHADYGPEVLQERVGELGQLAAYIALDLKTRTQPRVEQARIHFESLNEWHRALPPPMQLSRLSLADPLSMNWQSKRSLLQLHVLFLGLFIEPYRNCLLDLGHFRSSEATIELEELEILKNVEEQCVLAARQSARVVSLLQVDNLIRSHCWVSVYTCFTGCAVLLFSASQKLLELFEGEIGQDLAYASSHLNVLSLCSYQNVTARKLYIPLQIMFNDIREVLVSPVYRAMREAHMIVRDASSVPSGYYDAIDGSEAVSKNMLDLTKRVMAVLQESLSI
ncbi:hypothetical protein M3J09_005973 [Ascochyta lentis]